MARRTLEFRNDIAAVTAQIASQLEECKSLRESDVLAALTNVNVEEAEDKEVRSTPFHD